METSAYFHKTAFLPSQGTCQATAEYHITTNIFNNSDEYLKNKDGLKYKDDLKYEDNLKYEDSLKYTILNLPKQQNESTKIEFMNQIGKSKSS